MSNWLGRDTEKEPKKRASLDDIFEALEEISERLEAIEEFIKNNSAEKQLAEIKVANKELNEFLRSVVMTIIAKPTTAQLYAASKTEIPTTASVKEAHKYNGPKLPG